MCNKRIFASYPAMFTKDDKGGYVVTFRDIPEAITHGDTSEEALEMAVDVLNSSIGTYVDRSLPIPTSTEYCKGEVSISSNLYTEKFIIAYNLIPVVELCAKAMNISYTKVSTKDPFFVPVASLLSNIGSCWTKPYWPITDTEQAIALAKKFQLCIDYKKLIVSLDGGDEEMSFIERAESAETMNIAIVKCVVEKLGYDNSATARDKILAGV